MAEFSRDFILLIGIGFLSVVSLRALGLLAVEVYTQLIISCADAAEAIEKYRFERKAKVIGVRDE